MTGNCVNNKNRDIQKRTGFRKAWQGEKPGNSIQGDYGHLVMPRLSWATSWSDLASCYIPKDLKGVMDELDFMNMYLHVILETTSILFF